MAEERGAHATAARTRETSLLRRLHASRRSDQLLVGTVRGADAKIRHGRRRLDTIDAEIRAALTDPPMPALDTPIGTRQFQRYLAARARDIGRVVADTATDCRVRTGLLESAAAGYLTGGLGEEVPDAARVPGAQTDPQTVNAWWNVLGADQRGRLIAECPELGNLNGIPSRVRDRVNRQAMADDIGRVTDATEAISAAQMIRYDNALRVLDGLRADPGDSATPVLLLRYGPAAFDGRGLAAIAIGDPDTADNTTVLVPGAHCSVRDGYLSRPDAVNLYREAGRADPDRTNAVIMWMGYRAPDSLFDPQVAQPTSARIGGRALAADVNSLRVTNVGGSHVTVIGHSYGSTAVGDAAAGFGMRADDVVLVGSPGTDLARSAADFHLPAGGHVYVGAASSDPIAGLGGQPQLPVPAAAATLGLGPDPAGDGYGSTRFRAEIPFLTTPLASHSSYFTSGTESLFSIGDIASGHGDVLARDHMTAPHRWRFPALDPERFRPGSGGHRH